ncbi:sensor histidine kinase [Microbacterium invictum]|uniref:histidine kinase n=1 Tax=Microbacterium invictum TaxID=515415 RepID=A0AA40VLQ0_9MICO|nr:MULTISPECIES: HAMP domain-containing sensor histidine kinase [Microbacterium]MBB4138498.1 two-component system OmpR family sensor kinase [Microbacterium invictum]
MPPLAAHAKKTDRVTAWWRGISLRAKVTGVTVAVLAIGLAAAGIGTMVFLRTTQITALDQNLQQVVPTDIASTIFEVEVVDGVAQFSEVDGATPTQFFVAVYAADGTLLATGGGTGPAEPVYPETFALDETTVKGTSPFELESSIGGAGFHASVDTLQVAGAREFNTQLVALPLAPVNQTVASFIGIYTALALVVILVAALLTRWVVTLTFRGLGQVEDTAMSIAAGDFTQRMTEISPRTEVGRLKTAINAMLDRVDQALGQRDATVQQMRRFIGDASHELRTPLVTVRGYAELYRMGAVSGDEQTAQAMERIEKEAIRMGVLVEDLLALARLDERRDLVVAEIDLVPVARDAVLDARATSPEREVTFLDRTSSAPTTVTIAVVPDAAAAKRSGAGIAGIAGSLLRRRPRTPASPNVALTAPITTPPPPPMAPTGPPIVLGDENRIRQVVANLLGNARRYTPEATPIEVAVGVDAATAMGWIEVIDHGPGVPEQIRDKVFQRFWRADTSRTRETGGSGLGLSIVASIVDALHGTIEVVETRGGGATFRVSLPLAQRRDAAEHLFIETQPLPKLRDEDV